MRARLAASAIVAVLLAGAFAGCVATGSVVTTASPTDPCELFAAPPPADPETPAPGKGGAITLRTDPYGVTHVYADDAYGLFYGNGYVQARDRLFQLDLLRHVGYGDSASLVGPGQLASDMQVRQSLYSREEIKAQLAAAPMWLREALRAYSDGVNRQIAEATLKGELPVEFAALGHAPEPWTPEDSVAVINYLIGFFGVAGGAELENARTLAALEERTGSLERAYAALADVAGVEVTSATYTSIRPQDKVVDGCERLIPFEDANAEQLALALKAENAVAWGVPAPVAAEMAPVLGKREGLGLLDGFHWGSNALLVDGAHSTTGLPVMFGGPQMQYYKPPVPYEVGLHGAGFDVVGIGVAGAPGVVIGRTPTFAWSVTSGYDDMVDTVAIPLDPADKHRYQWDGEWRTMQCRTETHRTTTSPGNARAPQVLQQEVCRAEGMPVVAWSPEDNLAWAQRTTTRNKELQGAAIWLSVGRQTDLASFRDTLAAFPFTFNFNYAGPEGIAYLHTGRVPLRDPALDPRLPALPGSAYDWRGVAVGEGLGTLIVNPSTGYVAQWNNAPVQGWRSGDYNAWTGHHRVELLVHFVEQTLAARAGKLAFADLEDILRKAAIHDPFARHTVPHLVAAARASGDPALAPLADALEAWAADDYPYLDANGDGRYDHPGHAVWDAARVALQRLVLRDELGSQTPGLQFDPSAVGAGNSGSHDGWHGDMMLTAALEGRSSHAWCDDQGTPAVETCGEMLRASLAVAAEGLAARFDSSDPAHWLEPIHRNKFAPMGAARADFIPLVDRGSWNQVVAIGQGLDYAKGVLPPGNSGLLTAAEFALMQATGKEPARLTDQLGLYKSFGMKPLPVTPEEVASVATKVETLVIPAQAPFPALRLA